MPSWGRDTPRMRSFHRDAPAGRCRPNTARARLLELAVGAAAVCIASLTLLAPPALAATEPSSTPVSGAQSATSIFGASLASASAETLISGVGTLSALSPAVVATTGLEPVSVIVSPDGKSVYAGFERGTSIAEFSRDTVTGTITPLSPATVTGGLEPRTVAISPDGKSVYATNFDDPELSGGNTISEFSRNTETGVLTAFGSPIPTTAGPHGIEVSPDGKSLYVANYGARTVSQYSRNTETGALAPLSPATVASGTNPNGIAISSDGKSVYTANRGSRSVSQYSRNTQTGLLTPLAPATVEAGENPHDVAISPDGKSVYVPDAAEAAKTKMLSQFSRNPETGALTALSPATVATGGEARGVTVSSDNASVYVANGTEGVVSQYSRNTTTGLLAPLSPPSAPAGTHSYLVTVSPDGKSAYVANEKSDNISQYSRATSPPPPTVTSEPASAITNLTPNTTYHFRVSATNPTATTTSTDQTLKTTANAPTVTSEPASAITQSTATLNATVNPNGAEVTECKLEYGTTSLYGSSAPCTPQPGSATTPIAVSATITNLTPNTTYHFRVSATNPTATTTSTDQTLKTTGSPEYGRCVKVAKGTGRYENAGCTKLGGTRTYEWVPGVVKTHFATKINSTTTATLQAATGTKVTCTGETSTGEYTGLKTVGRVVFTFTGCERLGARCSTAGASLGELVTQPLEGVLGVITVGETAINNQVGLDLFPVGRTGPVADFNCGSTRVSLRGAVIVQVPTNAMKLSSSLAYTQAAKGKQKPESFVGEPKNVLEASFGEEAFQQTALVLKTTLTNEEPVEVRSA
jgi:DNA-binding beta-propeller fold protein YncE